MIHASLRAIGPVVGGPAALLTAVEEAAAPGGTLLMILGASDVPEWLWEPAPEEVRAPELAARAFHHTRTPALPEVGWLAEVFRTTPGTLVTDHPLGRFGARGARAAQLLRDAPWHDYYGPGSPLQRFVEAGGRVLRLGADLDTVTLLHYAEYLAPLADKRRLDRWVAVAESDGVTIRLVSALDDADGIVDWIGEDYFAVLTREYLATGRAAQGRVGNATSELLDGRDLLAFAVPWLARHLGRDSRHEP